MPYKKSFYNINLDNNIIDKIELNLGKSELAIINPENRFPSTYAHINKSKNF